LNRDYKKSGTSSGDVGGKKVRGVIRGMEAPVWLQGETISCGDAGPGSGRECIGRGKYVLSKNLPRWE